MRSLNRSSEAFNPWLLPHSESFVLCRPHAVRIAKPLKAQVKREWSAPRAWRGDVHDSLAEQGRTPKASKSR